VQLVPRLEDLAGLCHSPSGGSLMVPGVHVWVLGGSMYSQATERGKFSTSIGALVIREPEKGNLGSKRQYGETATYMGWGTHSPCYSSARREPLM